MKMINWHTFQQSFTVSEGKNIYVFVCICLYKEIDKDDDDDDDRQTDKLLCKSVEMESQWT